MHRNHRFVTETDFESETVAQGVNEWLCRAGFCQAEKLALCRVRIPPGEGHQFHRHPESEEIVYVVEGRAEQWVEAEKRLLGRGEIAHIPRDVVHATFNAGDNTLVILAILSPAETQGPFLVEMHEEEPWCHLRSYSPTTP